MSDTIIPFYGGRFRLREPGEFTSKETGERVKYGAAIIMTGDKKLIKHTILECREIARLVETEEFKAFCKKVEQ